MTKEEIKKLCKQLNSQFKPPFLPEGALKATPNRNGKGFVLCIGPRDVEFDDKLNVMGAGTCMM